MNEVEERLNSIRNLKTDKVLHFQYSKIAKIPFKVHSFIEIMNIRMIDFCESADLLIKNNHIIPSLSIIRALFENLAIIYRISSSINKSIETNLLDENFDELITKISFGTKYDDDLIAINILTQIDKLDKEYNGIRKFYDSLSEFVHPNCDGVIGSYSELYEEANYTEVLKVTTVENPIYPWIESCFLLSMSIYLDISRGILANLPNFTLLCEQEIYKKNH